MTRTARPRLAILFVALAALLAPSPSGPPAQAQDGSVPGKPTGLSTEASHDSVALAWDDPGDDSITHYQVFRRDRDIHAAGEFVTIKESTGSAARSYTDDTAEPERRYVYRVKAVNQHGASTWSSYSRANTPGAPPPELEPDTDNAPHGSEGGPPTGAPAISGTAHVDETLIADTDGISDPDGLTTPNFTYQWQTTPPWTSAFTDIPDATGRRLSLSDDEFAKRVRVLVHFTDDASNLESVASEPTKVVRANDGWADYADPVSVIMTRDNWRPVGSDGIDINITFGIMVGTSGGIYVRVPTTELALDDIVVTKGTASDLRTMHRLYSQYRVRVAPTTVGEPITVQVPADAVTSYADEDSKGNSASRILTIRTVSDTTPPSVLRMYYAESDYSPTPHQGPYTVYIDFSEVVRPIKRADFTITPSTTRVSVYVVGTKGVVSVTPPDEHYAGDITVTLNALTVRDYGDNLNQESHSITRTVAPDTEKPEVVRVFDYLGDLNYRLLFLNSEPTTVINRDGLVLQDAHDEQHVIPGELRSRYGGHDDDLMQFVPSYQRSYPACLRLTIKAGAFRDWAGQENEEQVLFVDHSSGVNCPPRHRPPARTSLIGLDLTDGAALVGLNPKEKPPDGKPTTTPDSGVTTRSDLTESAQGAVYTYQDGDRTLRVRLQTDLVAQRSADNTADDIVVASNGGESIVRRQPGHERTDEQPVFRSQSGGGLMTLPGGVLLVLDAAWDEARVDDFLVRNKIAQSRVSALRFAPNAFLVETDPGFPSLDLANALAGQDGVLISSPNWRREVVPY